MVYYNPRMAMGKRKRDRRPAMWVTTTELPTAASHLWASVRTMRRRTTRRFRGPAVWSIYTFRDSAPSV